MRLVVTWVSTYVKVHGAVYVLHCIHFAFYCGGGAVVQSLSHVWLLVTPWTIASQAPLSSTISEFAQIHVHWANDVILPSHPLPNPSPFAFNVSQHQGLFQWVISSHQVAQVLELQHQLSSVQLLSRVQLFATPRTSGHQASLSITNSWSLPKLMSIKSVMPSNHLILCHPLLLLPPIPPSIRIFSNESTLHIRWPKYWSFSFSISPSNEYSGQISFTIDWFDLLAVQGTPKTLLQHHSSKASILQCSPFFMVQLSHSYMTTVKKPELWKDGPLSAKGYTYLWIFL